MAEFFASAPKGMVEPLFEELTELGFKNLVRTASGVEFESNWKGCYKVNLESRIASRVLKPLMEFTAYQPEELYNQIRNHDFTKYIDPNGSLVVDAVVKESMMHDQRFVALKIKDAIVDQFRDKFGERPNVDKEQADLRIWVRGTKNNFIVALDTSGDALFQRGYRKEAGEAPIKENLAAGLLRLMRWDQKTPLLDPMCGAGTFLIEAALMVTKTAPGTFRNKFAFQRLKNFDQQAWDEVLDEAMSKEVSDPPIKFYGFDLDRKVIFMAKANAKRAGVDHLIEFKPGPIATLQKPAPLGMIVVNPPYAVRLGDEELLKDVYRDFSHTLKQEFQGWSTWILSGNRELMSAFKMKATRKFQVFNGNLDCRWMQYEIRKT